MKRFGILILCLVALVASIWGNGIVFDLERMESLRSEPVAQEAIAGIIRDADKQMTNPCPSVTDKTKPAPSGDKHDYFSMARYWWPNPNTPDGLPYVRKDGKVNPEIEDLDQKFSLLHSLTSNSRIARENSPKITITCFFPCTDMDSEWYGCGGQYREIRGICRKISQFPPHLIIDDYTIPLENISQIIISED